MDHQRLPRRCASHGTLRSSYNPHRRPAHSLSNRRPLHKPLRAVNENSILLPSPGALEGMLKTTTETGDIGMWTIKPVLPSTQRRESFSQVTRPITYLNRPHRFGPNDRDETQRPSQSHALSETRSLYTSGSQKSMNSTLPSNSTVGLGYRSFSMTTCDSRYLPRQGSSLTLQTQSSNVHLQRPRSPFPYPTRLKRPGVRPASPALTETGLVDYSRMVEIDRISSRTEHGLFRSLDTMKPQNQVPLGLRTEANGSTPHLSDLGVFGDDRAFRAPYPRTMSAASIASWNARNRSYAQRTEPRAFSLNPHSTRPISVSCGKALSLVSRPSASSLGARYFDYSEDFATREPDGESAASSRSTPGRSLADNVREGQRRTAYGLNEESEDQESALSSVESQIPTPVTPKQFVFGSGHEGVTLIATSTRSSKLESDDEHGVQSPWTSPVGQCGGNSVFHVSDIDLLPSQLARSSIDTFNPNMDVEAKDLALLDFSCYRTAAVQKLSSCASSHQVYAETTTAPTIHSEQGEIFGDETGEDPNRHDSGVNDMAVWLPGDHDSPGRASQHSGMSARTLGHQDRLDCVDKRLSSSTALSASRDYHTRTVASGDLSSSTMNDHEEAEVATSRELVACHRRIQRSMTEPRSMHYKNASSTIRGRQSIHLSVCPPLGNSQQRDAPTRISDPLPRRSTIAMPDSANDRLATALLEPTPISACRQLEVKNSIPQLMKALPPTSIQPEVVDTQGSVISDNGDYSEILKPYTYTASPTSKLRDSPVSDTMAGGQQCSNAIPRASPPKLRLKMTLKTRDPSTEGSSDLDVSSLKPARKSSKRLRLRSPHSSRQSTSHDEMIESALSKSTSIALPISEMHEPTRCKTYLTNLSHKTADPNQGGSGTVTSHTIYLSTTNNWKTETSPSNKPTMKLKNRMSSVVRWLEDIHDVQTPEFLTMTERSNTEQGTRPTNTFLQVSDANGRKTGTRRPDTKRPDRSLRKIVQDKINWLMKEAKGVVRGRRKRRGSSA